MNKGMLVKFLCGQFNFLVVNYYNYVNLKNIYSFLQKGDKKVVDCAEVILNVINKISI